jgi:predicted lipid-binding transport protein (Tim44 family)
MNGIPTDIIVYAAIAVVLIIWLGRVLGTRHGAERQRPNPFAANSATPVAGDTPKLRALKNLPSSVDAALVQIALADRSFDAARFLDNAKDAFALVVTAFADGDRETLKDMLAPDVYKSFEAEIDKREKAGQKAVTEVHSVRDADIIAAKVDGSKAFITLRFKADETYALSDSGGRTIAGHPDRIVTMADVWTFVRDTKSNDPRWFVSETRDDVVESGGMTLPDAGISV